LIEAETLEDLTAWIGYLEQASNIARDDGKEPLIPARVEQTIIFGFSPWLDIKMKTLGRDAHRTSMGGGSDSEGSGRRSFDQDAPSTPVPHTKIFAEYPFLLSFLFLFFLLLLKFTFAILLSFFARENGVEQFIKEAEKARIAGWCSDFVWLPVDSGNNGLSFFSLSQPRNKDFPTKIPPTYWRLTRSKGATLTMSSLCHARSYHHRKRKLWKRKRR